MIVTRTLGPNQAYAQCPDCRKETLFQKSGERWFCILFNSHGKPLKTQPEPKPKLIVLPVQPTVERARESVVENRLGLREFVPEPPVWTQQVGGRGVCVSCSRPPHHKPKPKCSELRHHSAYQKALLDKRSARRSTP